MGIAALEDICKGLLAGGMDPNVPAAVLQKGTTAGQKRVVATVGTLKEEVDRQGIETPAIIVVGKVCSLADKFAWYEKLPLAGWKVLVTRPRQHISKTADLLRQKGAEVLELRLSVQYLLRIMADCMRHLRNWILISGSFLQALQVWRSFLTRWTEKRWMCAAWDRRRSQ